MSITIQNQARKSKIFSLWRSRQIDFHKYMLMHASMRRIFCENLLGSEQSQNVYYGGLYESFNV